MCGVGAIARRAVLIVLGVLLAVVTLASPASATVLWDDEQEMIHSNLYRNTFIFDVGIHNTITHERFAAPDVAAFYHRNGAFDLNFMYWAPIEAINPPNEYWNGCSYNYDGGLCRDGDIVHGAQPIVDQFGSGPIHVKKWGGAFIGIACGNWNHGGAGPVPHITGVKFEDLNGDGARQPGEPGLSGWTIDLAFNGGPVATTTTGPDGAYAFALNANVLPIRAGTFTVTERQQPGWVQSRAPAPVAVGYGVAGATFGGNDFGNWRPATIQGRKFHDRNVDGLSAEEPGLPDWAITLNDATTTTAADGAFTFTGLRPGTYTVGEQQQVHWRQTAPPGGSTTITVTSGQIVGDIELGNVCLGHIDVRVPDGVTIRVDEVAVPGILENDPAMPRLGAGTSTIADLLPGSYRITLMLPAGVYTTDPDLTSIDGSFAIVKTITVAECNTTVVEPVIVHPEQGKVTGGIRILVPGGFATAGFEFNQRSDAPRGTLEFNDHATGLRVHTSDISAISVSGEHAYIFGNTTIDGATYHFRLHLVDSDEPGHNDRFELLIANGYSAGTGQTLDGGNVQIH